MLCIEHFSFAKNCIAFFEDSDHIFRNKCQFAHSENRNYLEMTYIAVLSVLNLRPTSHSLSIVNLSEPR